MLADKLLSRCEPAAAPGLRSSSALGLPIGHAEAVRAWRGSAACCLESRLPLRPPIAPPRRSSAAAATLRRAAARRRAVGQSAPATEPNSTLLAAQTLQRLPNGMLLRDSGGQVIDCNAAAERQLMLSRRQLLGQQAVGNGWQLLHADGRAMTEAAGPGPAPLAEVLTEALSRAVGQAAGEVIGVAAPDCRVHWLLVHTETVLDSDGRPAGRHHQRPH